MAGLNMLRSAGGALQFAGSFSGVPYAGAIGQLVSGIVDTTQQIVVHKRKCARLAHKANVLMSTLEDQADKMEGTELQQHADEVRAVLERVERRTRRYSRYNRVRSFMQLGEIDKELSKCESELDTAMHTFNINVNVAVFQNQRDTMDTIRSNSAATTDLLHQILASQEEMRRVIAMQGNGEHVAERLMEVGQNELRQLRESGEGQEHLHELMVADHRTSSPAPESNPRDSERYLQTQRGLVELHRATGIPPSVTRLDGEVSKIGDLAVTGGTYSDVWLGMWLGTEKVALKALRNVKATDIKAQRRFEQEIRVWAKLTNPHILSFYGIVTDLGQIHMVSPWQEFGNVLEYYKNNPTSNPIHLLSGASQGIQYLHETNIVHGNLKCANILVAADREARICDFGMSTVIEEVTEKSASATLTAAGSARWLAPELIEGSIASPTFSADVYSFSMAILELLTGKHPYAHRKRDASVIHDIVVLKKMPPRPTVPEAARWISDELWALMMQCWSSDANIRPNMAGVAARMMVIEKIPATDLDAMDVS